MAKVKRTMGDIRKVYEILSKLLSLGEHYTITGIINSEDDYNEIKDLREKFKD